MNLDAVQPLAVSANELADYLDLTPRRVRQLAEERIFVRRGRGLFDLPQALNASIGSRLLDKSEKRRANALTLAAVGWLHGFSIIDQSVGMKDRGPWGELCRRCGFGEDDATAAINNAVKLLGRRAPDFAVSA